jgi:GNAT superfamily N-acetyltransferase
MTSAALTLRPYRPADLIALYDVCLKTGDSGQDASPLYRDPMLLGHVYAGPYATLCPGTTYVLDDGTRAVGYVLGVPDSATFAKEVEARWSPLLRGLYPLPAEKDLTPDARMVRAIHRGYRLPEKLWLAEYPAHLHIDLLPSAQGAGHGRRLIETLTAALRERGIPGVHLGVGEKNTGGQAFYRRLGFTELERDAHSRTLGLRLNG